MRDYQKSVTTGQTDRQTPDKVIPMCRYASQATQNVSIVQQIYNLFKVCKKLSANNTDFLYLRYVKIFLYYFFFQNNNATILITSVTKEKMVLFMSESYWCDAGWDLEVFLYDNIAHEYLTHYAIIYFVFASFFSIFE